MKMICDLCGYLEKEKKMIKINKEKITAFQMIRFDLDFNSGFIDDWKIDKFICEGCFRNPKNNLKGG